MKDQENFLLFQDVLSLVQRGQRCEEALVRSVAFHTCVVVYHYQQFID